MTTRLTTDELKAEVAAIREGLQSRSLMWRLDALEQRIRKTMLELRVAQLDLRTPKRRRE
jgi:hypothetical protein